GAPGDEEHLDKRRERGSQTASLGPQLHARDPLREQTQHRSRKGSVLVRDEGQDGCFSAALGEPVVPTVCEVAKVCELNGPKSSFAELGFEVHRRSLAGGPVEHHEGLSFPKRSARSVDLIRRSPRFVRKEFGERSRERFPGVERGRVPTRKE